MKKSPLAAIGVVAYLSAAWALAETPSDGTAISTKIRRVTVYSDRARITRTGTIALSGTRQRLLIPDLPESVADSSVAATSKIAKILSIEVETVFGKRTANKEAEALLEKGKALDRRARAIEGELAVLAQEESYVRGFQVRTHPDEKGRPVPVTIDPGVWQTSLTFVTDGLASVQARQRAQQSEQRGIQKAGQALAVELDKVRSYESQATKVIAIEVDGGTGSADVEVTYAIVGPSWRPAYDVRVASATGKVDITTHGVVRQQTGEDWKDVELTLSTAAPAAGADLPRLLAWRLGDQQQYSYAAANGAVGAMNPGVALATVEERRKNPKPPVESDGWRSADFQREDTFHSDPSAEEVPQASSSEDQVTVTATRPTIDVGMTSASTSISTDVTTRKSKHEDFTFDAMPITESDKPSPRSPRPMATPQPPPPPPPPPPDPSSIHVEGENVWSLPSAGAFQFVNSRESKFSWTADVIQCPAPVIASGGFDYAFKPERKTTILSDGRERKVRLSTASVQAKLVYEIVAPISTHAYLRGTIVNLSRQPFLAGESFVFLDDDFVGRAFVDTVAQNEQMELSLGIDEDLKGDRRVEQSAVTSGVFSKKDRTVYTVSVAVKSFKKRAVSIVVRDDVPVSWQKDDIAVETLSLKPMPPNERTLAAVEKGLYAWEFSLPPGGKQDVKIQYAVERPRDFDLRETRGAP